MTDFRTWVVGQSAKLGYDFNALTREDQENIISALLSYAEDAFRSQCDYPDMRFGKRRGIYRAKNSEESPPNLEQRKGTKTQNYSSSSDTFNCTENQNYVCDNNCTNNSSCNDIGLCTDNNCTNSPECNDTQGCTDENYCKNQTTCTDLSDCVDLCCKNEGHCKDKTESSEGPFNIDLNCLNEGYCNDEGKCDDSYCNNSGQECRDMNNQSGRCIDYNCQNKGGNCDNEPSGTDQLCRNNVHCSDGSSSSTHCIDQLCLNYSMCGDAGAESNKCVDNACINSSSKEPWETCHDNKCSDISCFNVASIAETGSCQDSTCSDMGCFNYFKETCINTTGEIDGYCINYPIKGDNACGNTGIDTGLGCYDTGGVCKSTKEQNTSDSSNFPCTDNQHHCTDTGSSSNFCSDGVGCFNEGNCIDEKYCSDNQCTNIYTCRDESHCSDTNCKNDGLCQDDESGQCTDSNCINENCIDIGNTCHNDATLCSDENCTFFQMP